ncbi:MAG: molybdate ABC transporter substrate-binding protein [Synergistaceae bacterium]|jgi:molybdate transport system substrate-binding protein|nr:molybdate ABC transporter substrate-binding protein [Synergistaceae bacterium]
MKSFKKVALMSLSLFAFGVFMLFNSPRADAADGKTLVVFAAASMTESMNEIAGLYSKVAPDVKITYNFDSSGTLKTQIQEGADCDIFISAGQRQMNQIDIDADASVNTDKLDFVLKGTRFNIVSNKVVLIVPKGKNPGISDFKDAVTDKVSLIALGNSDVPVGQYSEEIYKNLGLWDQLNAQKKISFASNVKEVLSQVAAGAVDCGVVYSTDAATSSEVEVTASAPDGTHAPITYPAAILKRTKDETAARAFAEFLKGGEARGVFERIGFSIPSK